jgi:hypothetical protein
MHERVSIDDPPSARKNTMWGCLIDAAAVAATATRSPQDTIAEPQTRARQSFSMVIPESITFERQGNAASGKPGRRGRGALTSQVALAQHGAALHGVGAGDVDVGGCCEWCPQGLL